MPDDSNAELIERMLDTYEDAPLDMSDEEAMSRVLDVVREHVGQALAEAQKRIAALTADLRVEKGKSDDNA